MLWLTSLKETFLSDISIILSILELFLLYIIAQTINDG